MIYTKIPAKKWLFATTIFIFLYPAISWSMPREVTFFPDSARVYEVSKVKLQAESKELRKAVVILPGQANPDSFVASANPDSRLKIEDIMWKQVVRHDDAKIANLRKQLDKLNGDRKTLQSSIRAVDAQIQFWQLQTKAKVKTIADAHNMSSAICKNIKKSYHDKLLQESELEKLEKRIKETQEELDRTAGKKETAWEVAILFSGSQSGETTLSYTYYLSGCGWQPLYRLEAKPYNKQIHFTWEAELWQSSGQDWNNVSTTIATLKPPSSTAPADLPPWIIKQRPVFREEGTRKISRKFEAAKDSAEYAALAEEAPPVPRLIKESTYSRWLIGKKNLTAGSKQKVIIQKELWPAEFTYLARPSLNSQVFVRAAIKFAEPKEIPSGNCLFVIDDAILGKRDFPLAGQEATIFFGVDPLVTASIQLLSKKSDEKVFLQDKQIYTWNWQIDIRNNRTSPITILVEEPKPQLRDERIFVQLKNEPEPAEKTPSSLIWNLDLTAGEKKSIFTSVIIEAPKDIALDLGWRR